MFLERKFYLKEHGSFVLNLNVTDPLAKDSDLVKEYRTSSSNDELKKQGVAKRVGRAVAALSIDPQTHSTQESVPDDETWKLENVSCISCLQGDATPHLGETNLFHDKKKKSVELQAATIL